MEEHMERRLSKVEAEISCLRRDVDTLTVDFRAMRETLGQVVQQISTLSTKVDYLVGRLDAFPTKLQMAIWGLGGLGVLLGGAITVIVVLLRLAGYPVVAEMLQPRAH